MRKPARIIALLLCTSLLAACGFHLRGQVSMPVQTLYIETSLPGSNLIDDLRRSLEMNNVKLENSAAQAELVLNIVSESPEKQVLSLRGDGRVNEFRLMYRVSFRAYDQMQDWIPAEEITLRRDYSYDDTKVLSKQAEETMLYQSMRGEMVQQIMRRLGRARPQPK